MQHEETASRTNEIGIGRFCTGNEPASTSIRALDAPTFPPDRSLSFPILLLDFQGHIWSPFVQ
jgi:hypothetical protein